MSTPKPPGSSGSGAGGRGGGAGGKGKSRNRGRGKKNDKSNVNSNNADSGGAGNASGSGAGASSGTSNGPSKNAGNNGSNSNNNSNNQAGGNAAADKKKRRQRRKNNKDKDKGGDGAASGAGAGSGSGANINANTSGKSSNQKQGGGGGGGGIGQKQKKSKQKQKGAKAQAQAKPKEPPPPTKEELRILAEEKAQSEKEAAEVKKRLRLAEIEAERKHKKDALEQTILEKITSLTTFTAKVHNHAMTRDQMTPEAIGQSRKLFRDSKKKLKSDLKKCTAFCKKIKSTPTFEETTVKSLLKDVDTLNLTRYLEEIANAVMECKIRVVDVTGVVRVIVALHERYSEFMEDILLPRILGIYKKSTLGDTDAKYRRIYLRVLTEMLNHGVLPETKPVMKIVVDAAGAPGGISASGAGDKYNVTDANMLVSFAKSAGPELIGVLPRSIMENVQFLKDQEQIIKDRAAAAAVIAVEDADAAEATVDEITSEIESLAVDESGPSDDADGASTNEGVIDDSNEGLELAKEESEIIEVSESLMDQARMAMEDLDQVKEFRAVSEEVCQRFQKHLTKSLQSLSTAYEGAHKKLSKMEKRCEQDRLLAGTLTDQREKNLEDARTLLESLRKSVEALAEVLNEEVPELVIEEDEAKDESTGLEVYKGEDGRDANLGPFDDEETRSFYCDIPDLLTTIPPALLGYTDADIERIQETNAKKYGNNVESEDGNDDIAENIGDEKDYIEEDSNTEGASDEIKTEDGKGEEKDTPHYNLMVLFEQELPECNRKDKIDELAEKFCTNHGTSKNSRKRLEKAVFLVPRSRLDLLPYYSRLAAIFDRVYSDIAAPLVTELEQQFHGLSRWKKQQSIDNRIRNARFIGELTKFRVAPPIVALRCLRRCLADFSGYNVDIACCLLESCGRFLHRTKHTSAKLGEIMETMVRIRKAKHFDDRSVELMKSAFYMVKPPTMKTREKAKELSPIEAYLKHLLFDRLEKNKIPFISKQMLRLPWNDAIVDYGALTVKYMLQACRKGRYKSIADVASLASTIKKSKPEILARIIDAVLEELQFVMEKPNIRDQQRAIVYGKLLGELHSHTLVSSQAIFDQLFNFVNYDHDIPEALRGVSVVQAVSDPQSISSSLLKSSLGVSQIINEDEEMEEEDEGSEDNKVEQKDEEKPRAPIAVSVHSKYDPRVASLSDPTSAVFRVKLICTLLDSCATSIVTTSNYPKLEKFLAAFQRYLFIKNTLPTDIEFSLLDTFDLISSNLKGIKKDSKRTGASIRYETWLEAHNSVVVTEEAEVLSEKKAKNRLLAQAGIVGVNIDEDDNVDEILEDDQVSLDGSIDDMSANSMEDDQSIDNSEGDGALSDDDLSDDEDAESEDESEDEGDDEDDDSYDDGLEEAAAHEAHLQKLEDEAFDRELRKLTMDALDKGKHVARTSASTKVSDSMPSSSQIGRKKPDNDIEFGTQAPFALSGAGGMKFQLIKRDHKGRLESKSLVVPSDTNLAKVATKQDNEAARERDILKARVLRYEAEIAEQAYSGDVYSTSEALPENRNRRLLMEDIDRQFGSRPRYSYGGRGHRGGRGLKRF